MAVLPNRSDTNWYTDVQKATEIRIIKGRLKYNDGKAAAPFPSIIVVWGTPRNPRISWVDTEGRTI